MRVKEILASNKGAIIEKWFESEIELYPEESKKYFIRMNNKFGNPVGANTYKYITRIFNALAEEKYQDTEKPLSDLMHIRAVQEIRPSVSAGLFLRLKNIVSEYLSAGSKKINDLKDWESASDELTLKAFDSYLSCRERLYEIKANEIKNRTFRMIDRLSRKYDKIALEEGGEEVN